MNNKKNMDQLEYSRIDRDIINVKHLISSLSSEIENGGNMPNSVKEVLRNTSLYGIHSTIGSVINTSEEYVKAIDTTLSSCKNFIITDDESSSINAVAYLKENRLGRATFFPLSVIQRRYIDQETLKKIKDDNDFIAVAADVTTCDKIYEDVVYNQLGTVLISKDLQTANRLSKTIKKRYKIVTLDGDVVHVGGSISGGSSYQGKSLVAVKQELQEKNKKLKELLSEEEDLTKSIEKITQDIEKTNQEYLQLARTKVIENEKLTTKENNLNDLLDNLKEKNEELASYKNLEENSFSKVEEELINKYNQKLLEKENLILDIKNLSDEVASLKEKIDRENADYKVKNLNLRNLEKEMQDASIQITRCDVKLDSMLEMLNEEYSMTYERAKKEYFLEKDADEARREVNTYKTNIKRIGMVNLDSIEEFERVNTRYEFLKNQREDLFKAEDTLLDIMNEMDTVMISEFKTTFERIREEFKIVFKELFKGGNADLRLTNPDDLLTTGVEIVASPPGKKLTTISLLSGGEKTFTAISLLFAILNVKIVPFCIFDEVEAALDEANVASFGKYLNHYRNKTQFLIITHKKKTMEFADTLYGITMQESGVSKLVSVRLDNKTETI